MERPIKRLSQSFMQEMKVAWTRLRAVDMGRSGRR